MQQLLPSWHIDHKLDSKGKLEDHVRIQLTKHQVNIVKLKNNSEVFRCAKFLLENGQMLGDVIGIESHPSSIRAVIESEKLVPSFFVQVNVTDWRLSELLKNALSCGLSDNNLGLHRLLSVEVKWVMLKVASVPVVEKLS